MKCITVVIPRVLPEWDASVEPGSNSTSFGWFQQMRTTESGKKVKTKLKCPKCNEGQMSRVARRGFFRRRVFSFFGFYPWECAFCRKQFLIRKRGGAYRKADPTADMRSYEDRPPAPQGSQSR
jgi:ribosomal protein L37AE/L43A